MADYKAYVYIYSHETLRLEPVYQWLLPVLHYLSADVLVFFFIMAAIPIVLKWGAILKMSKFPLLSLLIWMSDLLIAQEMIAIRSAIPAAILLWIIYYICNDSPRKAWILCLAAIFFHYSAAVFLIVPLMSREKTWRKSFVLMLLVSMLMPMLSFSVTDYMSILKFEGAFFEYSATYVSDSVQELNAYNLMQMTRVLICFVLWAMVNHLKELDTYFLLSLKVYTIGCVLYFMCWKSISLAIRIEELLNITEILLYPCLLYCFGKKVSFSTKLIPTACAAVLFYFSYINQSFWGD
jgi:hypothetical protein